MIILTFPSIMIFPFFGLFALGLGMMRSAVTYRESGWIGGTILGLLFFAFGMAGILDILYRIVSRI